jgi:hypothetical protein
MNLVCQGFNLQLMIVLSWIEKLRENHFRSEFLISILSIVPIIGALVLQNLFNSISVYALQLLSIYELLESLLHNLISLFPLRNVLLKIEGTGDHMLSKLTLIFMMCLSHFAFVLLQKLILNLVLILMRFLRNFASGFD